MGFVDTSSHSRIVFRKCLKEKALRMQGFGYLAPRAGLPPSLTPFEQLRRDERTSSVPYRYFSRYPLDFGPWTLDSNKKSPTMWQGFFYWWLPGPDRCGNYVTRLELVDIKKQIPTDPAYSSPGNRYWWLDLKVR